MTAGAHGALRSRQCHSDAAGEGSTRKWGRAVAQRAGMRKAKVALARKLAVILHRMLVDGTAFDVAKAAARWPNRRRHHRFGRPVRAVRSKVPSPGRWIRSDRKMGQRRRKADRAPLDWPADPYQTPSGGGHRADHGQKRDTGGRIKKGVDNQMPVTEASVVR